LTETDDPAIVLGSFVLDVANFVGEAEVFALHPALSRSVLLDGSAAHDAPLGFSLRG